jgi:hypothetical protein
MSKSLTMRRDDAIDKLAKAMFGEHFVDSLSHREWWLIDSYRSPSFQNEFSFPGYSTNLSTVPPALRDELDRAIDRQAWFETQLEACHNWLINSGFPAEKEDIDRAAFDELFAKYFRVTKPVTASIPTVRTAEAFVRDYLANSAAPTLVGCRTAARSRFRGRRELLDEAYRRLATEQGVPLKQGPRRNVRENAAE